MTPTRTHRFDGLYKAAYGHGPEDIYGPPVDQHAWRDSKFSNPLIAATTTGLVGGGIGFLLAALMQGYRNIGSAQTLSDIITAKDRGSVLVPTAMGALAGAALGGIGSARLNQHRAESYATEGPGPKFAMFKEAAVPWRALGGGTMAAGSLGMGALMALTPLGLMESVPAMGQAWKDRDWLRFGGEALSTLGNISMFIPGVGLVAGGALKGLGLASKLWKAKKIIDTMGVAGKSLGGTSGLFKSMTGGIKTMRPLMQANPTLRAAIAGPKPMGGAISTLDKAHRSLNTWGRAHPWLSGGQGTKGFWKPLGYQAPGFAAMGAGEFMKMRADVRDQNAGGTPGQLNAARKENEALLKKDKQTYGTAGGAFQRGFEGGGPPPYLGRPAPGLGQQPWTNSLEQYKNLGD